MIYLFIFGLASSYFYSKLVLPQNVGNEPLINPTIYPILYRGMLIIPFNKTQAIHIHHWLVYLLICIMGIFIEIPKIIIGFSTGLFIQGFMYQDRFNLIVKNPYN